MPDSLNYISNDAFEGDEILLLQQLGEGDVDAFSALYKRYQPKLSRFLYPFRDIEDPKEIIQDIFLKIWEKRDALPTIQNFEQYLYRMAKNRLIDLRKSNVARKERELWTRRKTKGESEAAFEPSEYKEVNQLALKAMSELTERQRIMYRLRVFEDYSLDEISEKLSISKSVVIKQLYLATRFVREQLSKHQGLRLVISIGLSLLWSKKYF